VGYLGDLVQGDLGVSIRYNQPVSELIAERLPWTLLLLSTSMVLGAAVGLALGVHSAWRRGQAVDQGLLVLFMGMHNLPVFFVASMALLLFSVELGWVPLAGSSTPFTDFANPLAAVVDVAHHLVLPAAVMASGLASAYYLIMRSSLVSELGADYLMLGRAKGLRDRRLKYRYAGRNSLLVVVTWSAMRLEGLVTASVLVETVFAYQGMGRLMFDAVSFRDYPTLQACFLILTMVVLTANFLAELLYTRLDPRTSA
jgi:peptide/nickel transport system permease protein